MKTRDRQTLKGVLTKAHESIAAFAVAYSFDNLQKEMWLYKDTLGLKFKF